MPAFFFLNRLITSIMDNLLDFAWKESTVPLDIWQSWLQVFQNEWKVMQHESPPDIRNPTGTWDDQWPTYSSYPSPFRDSWPFILWQHTKPRCWKPCKQPPSQDVLWRRNGASEHDWQPHPSACAEPQETSAHQWETTIPSDPGWRHVRVTYFKAKAARVWKPLYSKSWER